MGAGGLRKFSLNLQMNFNVYHFCLKNTLINREFLAVHLSLEVTAGSLQTQIPGA